MDSAARVLRAHRSRMHGSGRGLPLAVRVVMRKTNRSPPLLDRPSPSHERPPGDVQRQRAEARPVRRQLLVGPLRHQGAGALVGELGGLPRARPHGATRPASTSCCRSAAGRAMAATPTCTARRSRPSPGRPACSPRPRASPCSAPCMRRCFIRSSRPSRSSPPTMSARAASASTSSPAGTRASSRCSACSSASTRRATPMRRSGSTPSSRRGGRRTISISTANSSS